MVYVGWFELKKGASTMKRPRDSTRTRELLKSLRSQTHRAVLGALDETFLSLLALRGSSPTGLNGKNQKKVLDVRQETEKYLKMILFINWEISTIQRSSVLVKLSNLGSWQYVVFLESFKKSKVLRASNVKPSTSGSRDCFSFFWCLL